MMKKNFRVKVLSFPLWIVWTIFLFAGGCRNENELPPFSPQQALGTFALPDGYRIELVASEPLITDPVDIAFDAEGLLYVAEMEDYPANGAPGGRIMLLDDKDQDGHFESGSVFAEGLPYVNGVMPWKKGVLVTSAPDILYLEDTTGDGRADIRRVVLTGFALTNPQLRMSSLRYGLDNWIYGAYSRAAGQRGYPEFTNHGNPLRFPDNPAKDSADIYPGNDFRFRPGLFQIEPSGGMSQFGLAFDASGNRFTVWNNIHLRHVVIEGRYLNRNPFLSPGSPMASVSDHGDAAPVYTKAKNRLDLHESEMGHFTSACGHSIYTGGLFGGDYQGAAFVCEPVSNLVHVDLLTDQGPTFTAKRANDKVEFLTSTDSWFRPVNTTVGPDGALYVVDFYRKLVEHPAWIARADDKGMYTHAGVLQESDFLEGNDRGRIYRVVPEDFDYDDVDKPDLKMADVKTLAAYLNHPNMWWRTSAQRLLNERQDRAAIPVLKKLLQGSLSQEGKIHVLWTLDALHDLPDSLIIQAMVDESAVVRKQAVILAEPRLPNPAIEKQLFKLASDPDDHVLLQVALTVGRLPHERRAATLWLIALTHLNNPWFRTAILLNVGEHSLEWFDDVLNRDIPGLEPHNRNDFLRRSATITGARQHREEISTLLSMIVTEKDTAFQRSALNGLQEGLRQTQGLITLTASGQNKLLTLVSSRSPIVKNVALAIADKVRIEKNPAVKKAIARAVKTVLDRKASNDARIHSIHVLGLDRGPLRSVIFNRLLQPRQPETVQLAAAKVLLGREDTVSMRLLLRRWNTFTPEIREVVENGFINSTTRLDFLLQALEKGQLETSSLSRAGQMRLTQHSVEDIQLRARKLFGQLVDEKRNEVVNAFYGSTTMKGDPLKGKSIFKNTCSPCHQLDHVGRHFGPDLLSLTNQTRINLLTMILDPNNNISPGYDGYVLETTDGRTFAGIMGSETADAVVLRMPDGKEQMIARGQIRSLRPMSASLMPDGLESGLSVEDLAGLLEYLKNPGASID